MRISVTKYLNSDQRRDEATSNSTESAAAQKDHHEIVSVNFKQPTTSSNSPAQEKEISQGNIRSGRWVYNQALYSGKLSGPNVVSYLNWNLDYVSGTWLIGCAHQKTRRHVLKRYWTEVGVPKSNRATIWKVRFEWGIGVRTANVKRTSYRLKRSITLHAQNMLGSTANMSEGRTLNVWAWSKYANRSMFNSQDDWGHIYNKNSQWAWESSLS